MKMTKALLALGILVTMLTGMPVAGYAETTTLTVTTNTSSGIEKANRIATLDDGTILGFYRSGSTAYFCGAISQSTEILVPDSILDSSKTYPVTHIGYSSQCNFDEAVSVMSLILPATVKYLDVLPSTVKVLHTKSYISNVARSQLVNLTRVLVPVDDLGSYFENTDWSNYVVINAEGTEPLKITVNVSKAGEFAQELLLKTDNWYKVNELTVVGPLSTEDLEVFKRMRQLTKLDLSKCVIADIPKNFDGANGLSANRNGFSLLESLYLPEVNKIGEYAFAQCYSLKTISLSKVNAMGYGAFAQCGATQITIPEGLISLEEDVFYHSSLQKVTLPSSLKEISNYCFHLCASLQSIEIPSSIKKIGNRAFLESGITSITLPQVETIGYAAFSNCKQLTEVKLGEGLVSIDNYAFDGCTALTEIDLPSTLLNIEPQVFDGCKNIKKVTCRATTPPCFSNSNYSVLYGSDMTDVKLYVPAPSIDQYRIENGWKKFYTILPLEGKIKYADFYLNATIDDGTQFASDCDFQISWRNQDRNYSSEYFCGAVDYNGNGTLSMGNFTQNHHLGYSSYGDMNQYYYNAHFTSLVSNGPMRADNVQTTLQTYSTRVWYFISLPYDVKVSDITYTEGTQFAIRKYSGQNRAQMTGNTWVDLTADDVMNAYEGYILKCSQDNAVFTFPAINNASKNKVFESESVVMPLNEYLSEFEHNRSWNLIGNPYPCYYDTRRMEFTAPITVWNRYSERYDAFSPVDDEFILHPAQAFFVQRPVDQASITFNLAGRQKDATVQALEARANTRASINADRKLFNIVLSDGTKEDRTRFVLNSDASCDYELDKDASKFICDNNSSMLIYTVENGVRYAINERPVSKGIIGLGFYAPVEGEYVLSLNTKQTDKLIIVDNESKTEKALTDEYRFHAVAGFNDTRFSLVLGDATGISAVSQDDSSYSVYTLDGRQVGSYSADRQPALSKGIYVISSNDKKHKIVVK